MTAIKVNAERLIQLPSLEEQRNIAMRIQAVHRGADEMLRRSLHAVEMAKKLRTASIYKIVGGGRAAHARAFLSNPGHTIKDLIKIKSKDPNADFWIQRRGSKHLVGRPKREYSQYDLGVSVLRKDILDPTWLFYMVEYAHTLQLFERMSHGTLMLQHITIRDTYEVLTAVLTGYRPNPSKSYWEREQLAQVEGEIEKASQLYQRSANAFRRIYEDWQDELGPTLVQRALNVAKKSHGLREKARKQKPSKKTIELIHRATSFMNDAAHQLYRYIPGSPIHGAAGGTTPEIPRVITHANVGPLLEALEDLVTNEGLWEMAHRDQKHWINHSVILEFPLGELAKGGLHTMGLTGMSRPEPMPLTGKERFDAQGLEGKVQTKKTLKDAIIALRTLPEHRGRILTK